MSATTPNLTVLLQPPAKKEMKSATKIARFFLLIKRLPKTLFYHRDDRRVRAGRGIGGKKLSGQIMTNYGDTKLNSHVSIKFCVPIIHYPGVFHCDGAGGGRLD